MSEIKEPVEFEQTTDDNEPKLPTLIGWSEVKLAGISIILAEGVKDHPTLGTHVAEDGFVRTSPVQWINRETKLVQTLNTLYRLEREVAFFDKLR